MGVEKWRNNPAESPKSQLSLGTGPYPNTSFQNRSRLTVQRGTDSQQILRVAQT